jgi:hypothetical protein
MPAREAQLEAIKGAKLKVMKENLEHHIEEEEGWRTSAQRHRITNLAQGRRSSRVFTLGDISSTIHRAPSAHLEG